MLRILFWTVLFFVLCFGLGLWGFVSWLGLLLLASIAAHCCTYE
jgi:hypothetical protein